jgi:hypothetical protein
MISARFQAGWGEINPRTVHVRRGGSMYELMLWGQCYLSFLKPMSFHH